MTQPPAHLPEDQVRVLELLIEGWTDRRIARELEISFSAVRRRLKRAAAALGATSRVQLAILAVERGVSREARTELTDPKEKEHPGPPAKITPSEPNTPADPGTGPEGDTS